MNELSKLLRDEKFETALAELYESIVQEADGLWDDREHLDLHWITDWNDALSTAFDNQSPEVGGILSEHIVIRLLEPKIVDAATLSNCLREVAARCNGESERADFEEILHGFRAVIEHVEVIHRETAKFDVCELRSPFMNEDFFAGVIAAHQHQAGEEHIDAESSEDHQNTNIVWRHGDCALRLSLRAERRGGLRHKPLDARERQTVEAHFSGVISQEAFESVSSHLPAALQSIARTIQFNGDPLELERGFASDATLSREQFAENLPFLQYSLDQYFGRATRKDSLNRRVHNALHLMATADGQTSEAVRLALSVAAIEAMLARGRSGVTENLSQSAAVLLEPGGAYRLRAERFIKELYGLRSDVLHGTAIDCPHQKASEARAVAAATLRAIYERVSLWRRLGSDPEDPQALFVAIDSARAEATRVDGVTDSPVRRFWEAERSQGN